MWDPVPQPGIKPRAPALRAWSLSHWTTREVHFSYIFNSSPSGKGWSVIQTRNVKTLGFADFLTSILCIIWLLILLTCPNHAQTISMLTEQMTVWSKWLITDPVGQWAVLSTGEGQTQDGPLHFETEMGNGNAGLGSGELEPHSSTLLCYSLLPGDCWCVF